MFVCVSCFFFKQKTAYEMRISDWSSDVCSSDLRDAGTLILSGANSYAGDTEVEAGTLVGNARALRGNVRNAATLVFDQRENGSFSGSIRALDGNAGTMVKRGSGVLTLTGPSTLDRSEEHTSELQSLMRTSYAVFC